MAATDTQMLQVKALLEEEIEDLASRAMWERQTLEQTFITIADEDQGALTSLISGGFRYILDQTIWDRTRRLPIAGPLDPRQWQALKARFVNGPYYRFRIRGGHFLVNPTPPAGESWFFEYITRHGILDADGVTTKASFTADTDTLLLPEPVLLMGLRWRWKKEKGMEYAEDFRTYESQVKDALGHDGSKATLCMDTAYQQEARPGVMVPEGSWNLP
jgi:hypothetical protein